MRPVTYTFATITQVEICATNATAASGASLVLNGGFSNYASINGAGYAPRVALPGIARPVAIYCTGNISTSTFSITGFDIRGIGVSTTFAGPTGTAIPTKTTQEFAVVTGVSLGNTLASSPFTVGFGPSGSTNWVTSDMYPAPFAMTVAVMPGATSGPITIQDTPDDANAAAPTNIFNHSTLATVTTNTESNYAFPARFVRAILTATSSATGAGSVVFIQAGS